MREPVEFRGEITLTKDEVLDVVGRCHEVLTLAEESGQVEIRGRAPLPAGALDG